MSDETCSEEDRAAKQSEVNLLMDEVERAQTRLLSLEREKVLFRTCSLILKIHFTGDLGQSGLFLRG